MGHFSCIMEYLIYCLLCTKCPSTVYIGETGHSLADHFREHHSDMINGINDLAVPVHFNSTNHTLEDMKVAVLKAGLVNQNYRKKQEMQGVQERFFVNKNPLEVVNSACQLMVLPFWSVKTDWSV